MEITASRPPHPTRRQAPLGRTKHVHMVGIGGIGMSSIAEVLLARGFRVSGSDLRKSEVTDHLEMLGATIYEGHAAEHEPIIAEGFLFDAGEEPFVSCIVTCICPRIGQGLFEAHERHADANQRVFAFAA